MWTASWADAAPALPRRCGALPGRPCLRRAFDLWEDEETLYTTWFDQETLLPLQSEISADGAVVFEVSWKRFEITETGEGESAAQEDSSETASQTTEEDQTAEG